MSDLDNCNFGDHPDHPGEPCPQSAGREELTAESEEFVGWLMREDNDFSWPKCRARLAAIEAASVARHVRGLDSLTSESEALGTPSATEPDWEFERRLPERLQFDPVTGDSDWAWVPLEKRLDRLLDGAVREHVRETGCEELREALIGLETRRTADGSPCWCDWEWTLAEHEPKCAQARAALAPVAASIVVRACATPGCLNVVPEAQVLCPDHGGRDRPQPATEA